MGDARWMVGWEASEDEHFLWDSKGNAEQGINT